MQTTQQFIIRFFILLILFVPFSTVAQDNINQTDENGRRQGLWKKFDDNGALIYEGSFLDDQPIGTFTYYYSNGMKKAILSYHEDAPVTADAITFHTNGKKMAEGTYQRKQRTGLWRFYNEEEVLVSEEYYKNGKRHGTASIYFPDGETVSEVCDYENGEKEGPWKQYFTDQTLKTSGNYVNGLLEGEVIYYHPDGKIMARGKYFRNKREGLWELFDKDGTSLDPQHYKAGVLLESE